MTSSLCWEPIDVSNNLNGDDDQLKFILREKYDSPVYIILDHYDLNYLQGLRDAKVPCADQVIQLIETYGQIRLVERC